MKTKRIAAWTAGSVLTAILVVLALKLDDWATPPATSAPLRTVTFDDRGELEIKGVSVGERVVSVVPAKRFKIPFFTSAGSSGGTWGGLDVNTEEEDDRTWFAAICDPGRGKRC